MTALTGDAGPTYCPSGVISTGVTWGFLLLTMLYCDRSSVLRWYESCAIRTHYLLSDSLAVAIVYNACSEAK